MYLSADSIMPGSTAFMRQALYRAAGNIDVSRCRSDSASRRCREADEVLICNALMPLVPVRRWEETTGPRVSFTIF